MFVANFLAYSFYSVLSYNNILLIEILININFIIFFILSKKTNNYINLKFTNLDILFFVLSFLVVFALVSYELFVPLWADEIAPTLRSTRTSYFVTLFLIELFNLEYLKNIPLKYLIHILNFFQLIFFFAIFFIFRKKKNILFLLLILSINFFMRYFLKDGTIHPPLNHLSSSIFVSFFGLEHSVVRLSYYVIFCLFLTILFKLVSKSLNLRLAIIFTFTVATFPLLNIASVIPDHSFWSVIVFTYLLIYVNYNQIDYKLLILIISIGILFRITIFTSFTLLSFIFLFNEFKGINIFFKSLKNKIFKDNIYLIVLIFVPVLLGSLIIGTPVYEGIENNNSFKNFYNALSNGIILNSFIKQIPVWYYVFFIFIFYSIRKVEIIIFFIINLIVYTSISEEAFGGAKYVLEYGVPFFILGQFILTKLLFEKKKIILAFIVNFLILTLNVVDISNFPKSNYKGDFLSEKYSSIIKNSDKKSKYVFKIPYSYNEPLNDLRKLGKSSNYYFFGTHYGYLIEVISGSTYNEIKSIKKIRSKVNKINQNVTLQSTVNDINEINNLEYILIANISDKNKLINNMKKNNWKIHKIYFNEKYRTKLFLMKKII